MIGSREVHLRDYLMVVWKRRNAALSFFIVVMSFVILGTFTAKKTYRASTRLLVEKVEPYTIIDYRYSLQDPEFYSTQYELIRSRPVAQKVVDSMLKDPQSAAYLKNEFTPKPGLLRRILNFGDEEKTDSDAWKKIAVNRIPGSIIVEPVRATRLVQVKYVSTDPKFAAILVNRLAEAYIEALMEMRMSTSQMTLKWMESQVSDERAKLEKSERVLQEYMRDNDIITLEDRLAILPQKLSELSTQLTRAQAKKKEYESLYARLQEIPKSLKGADSISVIATDPIVKNLKIAYIESERKRDELLKKFGSKHPSMKESENEVQLLRLKMEQEIRRVVTSVKEDYELAKQNENNLFDLLSLTKQEALKINEKFVQYGVLKRDVDTNRKLFDSLLKRMGEQNINEDIQSVRVIHLERAGVPGRPSSPRKTFNLFVGFIIGTLGGLGCAFFVEYFDNTLKSPEDIEERFGIPVIGMIDLLKSKGKDEDERDIETIVRDDPRSTLSEGFKAMRTAIMLSSAESPPRSLLVTSMGPEEGKTSTSINFSLAVSQFQKKVLLLDCDLRKPRIHKIFGIDNTKGISTYLAGDDQDIVIELTDGGLSIAPSGPIPPDPSVLFSSKRFDEFLLKMHERFDFIVCDSPPIMSISDALVLSTKMDSTVVVARAGWTTYDVLSKGLKALSDVNAKIVGILINAIQVRKGDYYYYKYYNNYYSYGYSEDTKDKQ